MPAHGAVSRLTFYSGMCDASAAVALDAHRFVVANDEDNVLRIYEAETGGGPEAQLDFTPFLKLEKKWLETDLEAATWLGDRIFWITSHGRNREGKARPNRHRFFATTVLTTPSGPRLAVVGRPYRNLLSDLARDSRLKRFNLSVASRRAPKSPDALNIEGLCATPDGHLLIGFRNPIPHGQALLVPLLNPQEVIQGRSARLGSPVLLNLDGLGIRDITLWNGHYVIIGGSYDGEGASHIYIWDGRSNRPHRLAVDLQGINPEAAIVYPQRPQVQLLSDDGALEVGGVKCKSLADPSAKSFRSIWITLPAPAPLEETTPERPGAL